ncbi:MAG: M20/M25/M40 family metallo-hydrolase [Betaproteobacteria bacterium]|nr:M20/M25/M40 family metallo-hydrolase [Betaproteobacteria bacterium]
MIDTAQLAAMKKKVHRHIDREKLLRLVCDLVNIPSPTGSESACADYIAGRFRAAGIKVLSQALEESRANAIGIIKGGGDGPCLMLNGHMDTSYVGDEQYLPDMPGYKPQAVVDGEWIYGLGVYNMKGSLAAFIHAAEALRSAGVELAGDLLIACVAGEIEKAQVGRFQGALYRGGGCGTWYAITHGAVADFAVVGEPSGMTLMRAHGGYVWTRITLVGDPMHTIYGTARNNTINNMMKVMRALQQWGDEYEKRRAYLGMPAHVTLSAIEGGWPYRCSRVPVACTLYVDTRLMPGQEPLEVRREIETVIADLRRNDPDLRELHLDMDIFMNQWGSECPPEEFIFRAVSEAHRETVGAPVRVTAIPFASDAGELTAHGIPALNYGATGRLRTFQAEERPGNLARDWNPQQGEHASIGDILQATKVYVNLILNVCTRTRAELGLAAGKRRKRRQAGKDARRGRA